MSRRASLPGAAELFRATGPGDLDLPQTADGSETAVRVVPDLLPTGGARVPEEAAPRGVRQTPPRRPRSGERRPSGRERHDEKITVYISGDELFDLEQARLDLRGSHGLAVDRGRIVREALSLVLADLEAKGDTSILVRRLRQS
jgi:hypothetical protein